MWNMIVKTSHNIETLLEDSEYEEDIWKLLGDRKLFTSQMGYDIEETIDGFVAKRIILLSRRRLLRYVEHDS